MFLISLIFLFLLFFLLRSAFLPHFCFLCFYFYFIFYLLYTLSRLKLQRKPYDIISNPFSLFRIFLVIISSFIWIVFLSTSVRFVAISSFRLVYSYCFFFSFLYFFFIIIVFIIVFWVLFLTKNKKKEKEFFCCRIFLPFTVFHLKRHAFNLHCTRHAALRNDNKSSYTLFHTRNES